jgi:RimJ/RimL family protein N-acetyltransferase
MTAIAVNAVRLRPHAEIDKIAFIASPREPEFYRLLGYVLPPELSRENEAQIWYDRKTDPKHSWTIEVDGRCVGSVWLHSIESDNRRARFAIEIFDPRYWGRGVGTVATNAVVKFAFEDLKLHRLDLRVLTVNERAIRCYERCGFTREGVQRDTLLQGGAWYSDLWMSILESEYQVMSKSGL